MSVCWPARVFGSVLSLAGVAQLAWGVNLLAAGIAFLTLLTYPFRLLFGRIFSRTKKRRKTGVKRVIVLGLDGMDPRRIDRLMKDGRLPNFSRLAQTGCYSRIESSIPPISPCAWSCFMTGSNPVPARKSPTPTVSFSMKGKSGLSGTYSP